MYVHVFACAQILFDCTFDEQFVVYCCAVDLQMFSLFDPEVKEKRGGLSLSLSVSLRLSPISLIPLFLFPTCSESSNAASSSCEAIWR